MVNSASITEHSAKENTPRRRSPCYSIHETNLLLELVEKYQAYILTKSTNSVSNHSKEVAWLKIARQFNNANLGHVRSANTLKLKWENMKRIVRNTTKNLIDAESPELDNISSRVIALLAESNSTGSIEAPPDILEEENNESEVGVNGSDAIKYTESEGPKDEDSDIDNDKEKRVRSQNFSTKETKLLLQCVKKEKRNIFTRGTTSRANQIKNKAWTRMPPRKTAAERQKQYREKLKREDPEKYKRIKEQTAARALEYYKKKQRNLTKEQKNEQRLRRKQQEQNAKDLQSNTLDPDKPIADSYNKLSPLKRSTKVLRTKFEAMKKMAKKVGSKDMVVKELFKTEEHENQNLNSYEELMNESLKDSQDLQDIKKEPSCEGEKSDQFTDNDSDLNDFDGGKFEVVAPDPLSSVLHGDSGMGSSSQTAWTWSQPENKEIVQLQKELLNYQMETAKLERKRVEEAIVEEARERESRALERSLRVRAARLEAVAGALRLPPAHPALAHPPEEARAQLYLAQYHG